LHCETYILLLCRQQSHPCYYLDDGGDRNALDNEGDVIPPSVTNRATSSQPTQNFRHTHTNDHRQQEDEAGDEDAEQGLSGCNEGTVQLPYVYVKVTHPPETENEQGRTKKVHVLLQLLSGTNAQRGYSVRVPPKDNKIIIAHQKGTEGIFWGQTGREVVPAGIAQDQVAQVCSEITKNYTELPKQEQVIEFPFVLTKVLRKKPFFVNTGNVPGQQFLGLYISAQIDWTDVEAEGAGEDYTQIMSPPQSANSYYARPKSSDHSTVPPANTAPRAPPRAPHRAPVSGAPTGAVGTASNVANNTGPDLSSEEEAQLLKILLARLNVNGNVHAMGKEAVNTYASSYNTTPTRTKTPTRNPPSSRTPNPPPSSNNIASRSVPVRSLNTALSKGKSIFKMALFSPPQENDHGTEETSDLDESYISYDDDVENADEVYNNTYNTFSVGD
jgi:hypothetical protein